MTIEEMKRIPLNESRQYGYANVLRVPNGWIYTVESNYYEMVDGYNESRTRYSSVFVPEVINAG